MREPEETVSLSYAGRDFLWVGEVTSSHHRPLMCGRSAAIADQCSLLSGYVQRGCNIVGRASNTWTERPPSAPEIA